MKFSADGVMYDFEENSADNIEVMAIERVTGMTSVEWVQAVERGSMLGITALVWIVRRRNEPDLEFNDVHFHPATLRREDDDETGKEVASLPAT